MKLVESDINWGFRAHDIGRLPVGDLAEKIAERGFHNIQLALQKAVTGIDASYGSLSPSMGQAIRRETVRRLVSEGKSITGYHVRDMRRVMENHLLSDPIASVRLGELKRSHILDFRERLIEKLGFARTVQKAVGVLKTILKEAYFREDISRDPTIGIGNSRHSAL